MQIMRFTNLDGHVLDKKFSDFLRWKVIGPLRGERRPLRAGYKTPARAASREQILAQGTHLTWVGHASFLLRLGGQLIATDPVFSDWIGPVRRQTRPGLPEGPLPPVNIVTVSHSHYDHMDLPSLRRIGPDATYVVPTGNGSLLREAGLEKVIELDWWQTTEVRGVTITLVPAQHWSMRLPWDRNQRLWGGFVYESEAGTAYHSGDTAWNEPVFRAIATRFPEIDWAMMPIGAYAPEWFMGEQHITPEDAARAWRLLGAKYFCAMHWGTFDLADAPRHEPPERILAFWEKEQNDPSRLLLFDIGETKSLAPA